MINFILSLLYFLTGKLSLLLLQGNHIINIGIFAAEGISLGFALYYGKRVWIGVFIGQFLLAQTSGIPFVASFFISGINATEAILAVYLFKKFHLNIKLNSIKDAVGLFLMILFVLQPFSAILSNAILYLSSIIEYKELFISIFSWWFGNVMGQSLFAPFTLFILLNWKKIKIDELMLYSFLYVVYLLCLVNVLGVNIPLLLLCFTILPLIYIVLKEGAFYGMLYSVIVAVVFASIVHFDIGAFSSESYVKNIVNYNIFILIHIFIVFIIYILIEQRRNIEKKLRKKIQKEIAKNEKQKLLLIKQSRLAQMGEMIAMIAHQWRQPLNNLSLVNQLLVLKHEKNRLDDESIAEFRENSKKQINLMSTTIDDFRNFFKEERRQEKYCINDVIQKIINMVRDIYTSKEIMLDFEYDGRYCSYGYPNELGQALLNIINNAKDELEKKSQDQKYIKIKLSKKDDFIHIDIMDNAGGIPKEIVDRIFEPYFSTKGKNGTGLGLYMTKMIIEDKFNGKISVINKENGACFTLCLKEEKDVR